MMIYFGKYQKMTIQLFSEMLSRKEEDTFGEFRSFKINPELIEKTGTYTRVDNTGIYQAVLFTRQPFLLFFPRIGMEQDDHFYPEPKKFSWLRVHQYI